VRKRRQGPTATSGAPGATMLAYRWLTIVIVDFDDRRW
jgi:hypothetical protein